MTDTITESFCERCGARYSFEKAARPRRAGLGRVRVLTRGLRNYVTNDGLPMAEAMAAARDDEARSALANQLDAFHRTFNFCLSCRQYTCPNCWNEKAGECLTCAPDLTREVLPAAFPDLRVEGTAEPGAEPAPAEAMAWPRVDLERGEAPARTPLPRTGEVEIGVVAGDAATREAIASTPTPQGAGSPPPAGVGAAEALAALEGAAATVPEELTPAELAEIETALAGSRPELGSAEGAPAEPVIEATPAAPDEPAAIVVEAPVLEVPAVEPVPVAEAVAAEPRKAAATPGEPAALRAAAGVAGEAALPAEIAALAEIGEPAAPSSPVDRAVAARGQTRSLLGRFRPARAGSSRPGAVPSGAAAPPPGSGGEVAAASAAEPMPAALAAEPSAAPAPASAAEPVPAAPAPFDTAEQPTWRVVAPDSPAEGEPAWPDAPGWAAAPPAPGRGGAGPAPGPSAAPWAARLALSRPEPTSVWAASSREVLAGPPARAGAPASGPAVQSCVSCGLSLSANARFCRRCGTRQG
ncbi:MAG: hypothetical protein M0T75_01900 [Chloroflexi bacterium]|nr:hypothetical protein [Chloroflexota bacterium]